MPAWILFAACALLPIFLGGLLAWRARTAAIMDARAAEAARRTEAASAASIEIGARLAAARTLLLTLPVDADPLVATHPPGMIAFVLDVRGALAHPAPPASASSTPSESCIAARDALFGSARDAARATILGECPELRTASGRFLWPLLAIETDAGAGDLPAWITSHAGELGMAERGTLRRRIEQRGGIDLARALAALSAPSSDACELRTMLETKGVETSEGPLRIRTARYVAVTRMFADGRTGGLLLDARSLLAAPPMLPEDLLLEVGTAEAANVDVAPELAFHVAPRDARLAKTRLEHEGNKLFVLGVAGALGIAGLVASLYSRLLRARRLAELRTDFVAAVSHELRTPLASVHMLAELLEGGFVTEQERPEIEGALARESRRLSETLERMLRFGALSRGKLSAARAIANLSTIAEDAVARLGRRHPEAVVVLDVDPDLEAVVDAGLLGLALDNLLGNAVKYAPDGGPYGISMTRKERMLSIVVTDRGPGLDGAARRRIFRPFERADDRLSRATEGTGVGLALVSGIAEAHGGRARVESSVGKGASFILEIPWKPS